MANMTLTTRGPICKTFTLTGGTDRPFTRSATGSQLLINGVAIADAIGPTARIRMRSPSGNATTLYGDSAIQQVPLLPDTTTQCNERWEHIQSPENLYFVGTSTNVIQFEIYL